MTDSAAGASAGGGGGAAAGGGGGAAAGGGGGGGAAAGGGSGSGSGGAAAAPAGGSTQQAHGTQVTVDIDPTKIKDLIANKTEAAAQSGEAADTTHTATHAFKIGVQNTTWSAFKTGVGDGSVLSGLDVYGDPKTKSSEVSGGIHADLFSMHWKDVVGASMTTTLGDDLKWTDGKSLSDDINIKQDVTWKGITAEGEVETIIEPSGKVNAKATVGLKFNF